MRVRQKALLLFFLISIAANAVAQDPEAFNAIYKKTYLETAQKDMNTALFVADSLYRASVQPLFRVKSLMLSATLYQQKEHLDQSIGYAEKARELVEETGDYNWQARVYGFLATQYRLMQLYSKSKRCSEKVLELVAKIEDPENANSTRGLMQQELAYYYIAVKNYQKAILYVNEAQSSFDKTRQDKDFFTMNNEQLLGLASYQLKNYDAALVHYRKALNRGTGNPENFITGLVYKGMADVYLEKSDTKEAKKYLDRAEKIAEASQYLQLKNEVYASMQNYYARVKDEEQLALARQKKDSVAGQIIDKSAAFLNDVYIKLEEKGQKAEARSRIKTMVILVVLGLLLLGILLFLLYRRKQKRQLERFENLRKQLSEKHRPVVQSFAHTPPVVTTAKKSSLPEAGASETIGMEEKQPNGQEKERALMSLETEQKLLTGLKSFETSERYLDNSLSLSSLAARLGTNTKYLSYMIKTYKKSDFNNYVNELRVNYIIEKLKENPEWRQYKISALAAAAGFSSHSKFATIFKASTRVSPSVFIQYLDKQADM